MDLFHLRANTGFKVTWCNVASDKPQAASFSTTCKRVVVSVSILMSSIKLAGRIVLFFKSVSRDLTFCLRIR